MEAATEVRMFGVTARGEPVRCYTIRGAAMQVELLDYGAAVRTLRVPDREGRWRDVALGYDTIEEYETKDGHLGACIGRHANRLGGAEFTLNGTRYALAKNDGSNHLHGGVRGFDHYVWNAEAGVDWVRFSRISPDGEEGYPGALHSSVTYRVAGATLEIIYEAVSDQDTLCNLTNHTYWNLNGGGTVLDHLLRLNADCVLENTQECLPTGRILSVAGTPMDFRSAKPIGQDIGTNCAQLQNCGGYDHNFCLNGSCGLREAAMLHSPESGITMCVKTTLPGLQVYTSNALSRRTGKQGAVYDKWDAVCLETQFYPNSMCCKGFDPPILRAGERWHHVTQYSFSV